MKAENWEKLNGTGWGENPEKELEIPAFMFETTQSVLIPAAAYRAQGVGRVKQMARAEKKQRRDFRNGIAYIGILFGLLVFANLMMELVCG